MIHKGKKMVELSFSLFLSNNSSLSLPMDAFDFSNAKAEKHNLFSGIAKTLRILELCLALLFLSWFLTRLPFALRLSADYLRSPLFVFALSNAIIAALLAQSGLFTSPSEAESAAPSAQETECQDKQIMNEDSCAITDSALPKVYRRSQSETLKRKGEDGNKTERRKLRRSETEIENLYPQDKLSNEEFQRTIEAFIAKQMRLLREESLAIFVHPSEPTNNHTGAMDDISWMSGPMLSSGEWRPVANSSRKSGDKKGLKINLWLVEFLGMVMCIIWPSYYLL